MPGARIFVQLITDFVVYLGLLIRPRKAIAAENLFLRRQLALYQERKVDPRRIDPATRITLAQSHERELPGQIMLVTGAGSGSGRATAIELARPSRTHGVYASMPDPELTR